MKKTIYIIVLSIFVTFAFSCGNKTTQSEETHSHADGTVHEGSVHTEATETAPEQESFEVEADSSEEHSHDHDHDHSHDHQ
ncbi:MAG: hypothetical protein A2W99_00590 [Bacteroidetes bacterium GWF2_33_16]|nr:MAG: hypothetical protein A2X00_03295 [Bacteroidetes bacterium GWE2_32_14]OFY08768.1 MAG: hypothetical protein A2W99_00590 [Bacteroidetes bacterium GWF2_33_16]